MKKLLSVSLALLFSLSLIGCSSDAKAAEETVSEASASETKTANSETTAKKEETTAAATTETTTETTKLVVENPDFRNVKWGMTKEEVIASEGSNYDENDTCIAYEDVSVANKNFILGYYFDDAGKLYQAIYIFDEKHSNDNLYISDHDSLKKSLTEKYGTPYKDEEIWLDDLFKDNPNDYGRAVSYGHLLYRTYWHNETTDISLFLAGDNFDIDLMICYDSKTYTAVENNKNEGL